MVCSINLTLPAFPRRDLCTSPDIRDIKITQSIQQIISKLKSNSALDLTDSRQFSIREQAIFELHSLYFSATLLTSTPYLTNGNSQL